MANVLTNFIVGLGFDVDNRSLDQATSSIDKIGSTAKQVGAAMLGGFGLKALTLDLAKSNSELGRFSEKMGVNAQFIKSLGTVYKDFGGDISTAMSDVALVESMRTMTEDQLAGAFSSAGVVGFDASLVINAESAEQAINNIANLLDKMPREEQLQIQRNLGFSDSLFFASEGGADALQQRVDLETQKNPITQEHIENSKELNAQYNDLMATFGAFSDRIGNALIPAVNDVVSGINNWFDANRELINSGLDTFLGTVTEHFDKIIIAVGILTAGKTISALNMLRTISTGARGGDGGDGGRDDNNRRESAASKILKSLPILGTLAVAGEEFISANPTFLSDSSYMLKRGFNQASEFLGITDDHRVIDNNPVSDVPDVWTNNNSDVPDVWNYYHPMTETENVINSADPTMESTVTPEEQASVNITQTTTTQATQAQAQPININLTSTLDGKVLDERIVTVTGEQYYVNEQETISTTAG